MNYFTSGLGAGLGAGAGMALANALFSGRAGGRPGENLVWAGDVNGTILMIMQQLAPNGTVTGLHLYGIENGGCVFLGAPPSLPQMMALVQQWQHYLTAGHTVQEWYEQLPPPLPRASQQGLRTR